MDFKNLLIKYKSLVGLLLLIVVVSVLSPSFLSTRNILNILRQTSVNAIIAAGMTFVILTGGIDLSVGSVLAISGAFAASLLASGQSIFVAVIAAVVCGAVVGFVNGFVIAYALGGNEEATKLSGLNTDKIKIWVYTISGILSAIAGIIITSRLYSAQPTAGTGYELDAIAAVVLGGTKLTGGKGKISGTIIGALIIGVLSNALNILDVSSYYQMMVKGIVILIAVLLDRKSN